MQTGRIGPRREIWAGWQLLLFWPAYGAAFYALEWVIPQRVYQPMYHPLDEQIPFVELFVIPYVFWYVYMVGSVAVPFFRDKGAYRRVMGYYILVFTVSTLVFALYPTCQNFRPAAMPRDNALTRIMAVLYAADTSTNVCPSLHVSGAIGAALGFLDLQHFRSKKWKMVHITIAGLICLSTVFVRQHSVVDVFWGLVLSAGAWAVVYLPKKSGIKNRDFVTSV